VKIDVFDVRGRFVRTVKDGQETAGLHRMRFDGSGLSGGMYIARIAAGSETVRKKMMLVK
jgi:hypothetical protein